jgi:WS/DGAT/MGAT family acyltransferase
VSKKITFLDKSFWITESEANPKHVAGLQLLELPEDAADDYVAKLFAEMKGFDKCVYPFNSKVECVLNYPVRLKAVEQINMDYHVQMHELDDINDKPELHKFIASLHEVWLDRDKPLWQFHLIKDKKNQGFGIYIKVHHLYGDGTTLMRWFQNGYSEQKDDPSFAPVWAAELKPNVRKKGSLFRKRVMGLWDQIVSIKDLTWILFRLLLKLLRINQAYMPVPFTGTKTILTGQVTKGRAVSTLEIDFTRVTALSKRVRASANEIMLCAFDIGVNRFLKDYGITPSKALYTNMPINLRKPGETTSGNKIAIVPVMLAYGKTDPYLRLRQIIENHRVIKRTTRVSEPTAFTYYTMLIQSFSTLFEMLRISDWVKPIGNILISNMPGPKNTLYFKDAKLISNYPVSAMTPGGGVNITMLTYNNIAQVGIVCCNSEIESLEPMAKYFVEAFDMLEACVDDPSLNVDDIAHTTLDIDDATDNDEIKFQKSA